METVHSEDRYLVPPQGGPALIRRIAGTSLSVLSDILTTSRPALLAEESEWVPLPPARYLSQSYILRVLHTHNPGLSR